MNIIRSIERALKKKQDRGHQKLFWLIDLHDCMIPGTYTLFNENKELYPYCKETLKYLSFREDMCLILWTSSYIKPVTEIIQWLSEQNINFKYFNCNPECENTDLCDFGKKLYFDICLDDKAGFEPDDWKIVYEYVIHNI